MHLILTFQNCYNYDILKRAVSFADLSKILSNLCLFR